MTVAVVRLAVQSSHIDRRVFHASLACAEARGGALVVSDERVMRREGAHPCRKCWRRDGYVVELEAASTVPPVAQGGSGEGEGASL